MGKSILFQCTKSGTLVVVENKQKILDVVFFEGANGREPVREWLLSLQKDGIARVFFTVDTRRMILLHGFVKKSQATPKNELQTAKRRLRKLKEGD